LLMRIYFYIRYWGSAVPKEMKTHKLNKLLLMTHGMAMVVNIGKVVVSNNPLSLNLPMLLRIMSLVWSVVKEEANLNHKANVKVNLGVIKNKCETLQTLVMLDDAICYTIDFNRYFINQSEEFKLLLSTNNVRSDAAFEDIDSMLLNYKNNFN